MEHANFNRPSQACTARGKDHKSENQFDLIYTFFVHFDCQHSTGSVQEQGENYVAEKDESPPFHSTTAVLANGE